MSFLMIVKSPTQAEQLFLINIISLIIDGTVVRTSANYLVDNVVMSL